MSSGGRVRKARGWHVWLALIVGIQAAIWAVSGLYMTVVPIGTIHGNHLLEPAEPAPLRLDGLGVGVADLRARYGILTGLRMGQVAGRPFLLVEHAKGRAALDPATGAELAPPDEAEIRRIATALYAGDEPVADISLIEDIPGEIRGRPAPLWRVEFDHWNRPTFYLSPVTGELVSRRHELWRVFDFLWMLHIMDYEEREDVNNLLLRAASLGGIALALAGLVLLVFRLRRTKIQGGAA